MIDTKELRRLAQAATPGPWIAAGPSFGKSLPKYLNEVVVDREGDEDDGYSICNTPIGLELSSDMAFIAAANPATVIELLGRLEAAESDALEQARLNGMGASREAALMAKLEAAEKDLAHVKEVAFPRKAEAVAAGWKGKCERLEKECDALRAKIEQMENQEPAWFIDERGEPKKYHKSKADYCKYGGLDLLYNLPGAKGE